MTPKKKDIYAHVFRTFLFAVSRFLLLLIRILPSEKQSLDLDGSKKWIFTWMAQKKNIYAYMCSENLLSLCHGFFWF